jgi:integrase
VHLLPFLGYTDIRNITRAQLKRFIYEKLNADLSRNTVKATLAPLSEMFNHAIEDGHLERNPCFRILRTTRKEKGEQQRKVDFLTREELSSLLDMCREHVSAWYPFVLLLARTGLRIGEAVALQ